MWKVSLHYLQNGQNYAAFSHGNSAVEPLSKIVSTIQDSANAVSANTFLSRDKYLRMFSVTVRALLSNYL